MHTAAEAGAVEAVEALERCVWDALRRVEDPEMPVSLVDLGLIYGVRVDPDGVAEVDLTFTAMGCPATDFILEDVRREVGVVEGIVGVRVRVVWDPPWSSARLSPEGREALQLWGLAV